jgi:hypothetical protein
MSRSRCWFGTGWSRGCHCFWLRLPALSSLCWELPVSQKCVPCPCVKPATHTLNIVFLLPLFLSITLLTKAGFFDQVQNLIRHGTESLGPSHVAFGQFVGSSLLSAILDSKVVADFALRALHGLLIDVVVGAMPQRRSCICLLWRR